MKVILPTLFILFLFSACSQPPKLKQLYSVPHVEKEKSATIYMFADSKDIYPLINGQVVGHLQKGEYAMFDIPEGEYMLGYAYPVTGDAFESKFLNVLFVGLSLGAGASPVNTRKGRWAKLMERVSVLAGDNYYYVFSTPGLFSKEFVVLESDKVEAMLNQSKLVPTGHFSGEEQESTEVLPLPQEFLAPYN